HAGWSWQLDTVPRPVLAGAWAMSLAVPAALAPFSPTRRWLGHAPLAFRLSLALTLMLIAQQSVMAIFASSAPVDLAPAGLACVGAVAVVLLVLDRRDILMLAATALAIDSVLISGIVRLVMPKHSEGAMSFIVIGLGAAAVIALSVVAIMRAVSAGTTRE